MLAPTDAAGLLLESPTRTPPAGAGALSVTVPEEVPPPVTVMGNRETLPILPWPAEEGLMVKPAEAELVEDAVMVAVTCEATELVRTLKLPVV